MRQIAALALAVALAPQFLPAQQPEASGAPAIIRTEVDEVVLDLVVRDKRQKLVRDLQASDVEIYEDGIRQDIRGFTLLTGSEARAAADQATATAEKQAGAATGLNPLREFNFVCMVLRPVDAVARQVTLATAKEFLQHELRPNTYVGVFVLDRRLRAIQTFTNDRALLEAAVDRAARRAYPAGVGPVAEADARRATSSPLAASGSGPSASIAEMLRTIEDDPAQLTGFYGMYTLDALRIVVNALARVPGRKTVLWFDSGLLLPPALADLMSGIISSANRSNITFYGIDPRQLSTFNPNDEANRSLRALAAVSASQSVTESTTIEQMRQDDAVLYTVRAANPQESLRNLAESTGGFLIANSNDYRPQLRRVMEDVNTHYVLTYTPRSRVSDGRFRRVEVRTSRPGLEIRTREGYYALPKLNGKPVESWELAALRVLTANPLPLAFPFRAGNFRLHPTLQNWEHVLEFELPNASLAAASGTSSAETAVHASVLALVKNSRGEIVDRLSRDLAWVVPKRDSDQFRAASTTVLLPYRLAPGTYSMECVVLDRVGERAGTKKTWITVPEPEPDTPNIGGVVLVKAVEHVVDDPRSGTFRVGDARVTPALANSVRVGDSPSVYFEVSGASEPALIRIELLRDGAPARAITAFRKAIDERGILRVLADIGTLQAGNCEVRVSAGDDTSSTFLTVAD